MSDEAVVEEGQELKVNPFDGLQGEAVWEEVKKYPNVLSALDSRISTGVNSGVENFRSGKMQDEWKLKEAELRASIDPEESEASKVSREFQEFKTNVNKEKELSALKDKLSVKAAELDFDPIRARRYSKYGENAIAELESDSEWLNTELDKRLSSELKDKYTKKQPKMSSRPNTVQMSRTEYNTLSPYEQRSFVVDQKGIVVDQ